MEIEAENVMHHRDGVDCTDDRHGRHPTTPADLAMHNIDGLHLRSAVQHAYHVSQRDTVMPVRCPSRWEADQRDASGDEEEDDDEERDAHTGKSGRTTKEVLR